MTFRKCYSGTTINPHKKQIVISWHKMVISWHDIIISWHDTIISWHDIIISCCVWFEAKG